MTEKEMKKRSIKITICVCIILNVLEMVLTYPYREISPVTSRLIKEYLEIRDPENIELTSYSIGVKKDYQRIANRAIKAKDPVENIYEYYENELKKNGWIVKKKVSDLESYHEKSEFDLHIRTTDNRSTLLIWMKIKDGIGL